MSRGNAYDAYYEVNKKVGQIGINRISHYRGPLNS